jgi:hypothetical protein
VRRNGSVEPIRLAWPSRPEPGGLPADDARCCAVGSAWRAPQHYPAGSAWPGSNCPPAGDGTLGRSAATGRGRGHGWRTVGRGLVSGGFLLCGWLITSTGHAYAAQITAPPVPHINPAGIAVPLSTGPGTRAAGITPADQHPASSLHAVPSFSGHAGAGAGIHTAPASTASTNSGDGTVGSSLPAIVSGVSQSASSLVSTPASALGSGLSAPDAGQLASTLIAPAKPLLPAVGLDAHSVTTDVLPAITPAGSRPPANAAAAAGRRLPRAARPGPHLRGLVITRLAAASQAGLPHPAGLAHGYGRRLVGKHATARHGTDSRRRPPADRLSPNSAAQTDPASSGGAGSAQLAAQVPLSAAAWSPEGKLVRIDESRWPAIWLRADDPAVSPD